MFTGIVEAIGRITAVERHSSGGEWNGDGGLRIRVDAAGLNASDIRIGDSIAISGACMTVVAIDGSNLAFDVSAESLRCTVGLAAPGPVNLERSLRFGDRIGGHLVAGHVDGIGTVRRFEPAGDSRLLEVVAPDALARYIAVKGSIAIDGVSLTVNAVDGSAFSVNLIPHTLAVTTLGSTSEGRKVNLEVDLIARHLERLLEARR